MFARVPYCKRKSHSKVINILRYFRDRGCTLLLINRMCAVKNTFHHTIVTSPTWFRVLGSIVVSIPACHAGDRGSIPRRGGYFCDIFLAAILYVDHYKKSWYLKSIIEKKKVEKNKARLWISFPCVFFDRIWPNIANNIKRYPLRMFSCSIFADTRGAGVCLKY